MGSHLQLYASQNVILYEVKLWCELKTVDIVRAPSPAEQPAFDRVSAEMRVLEHTHSPDHLEHWASGGGIAAFPFLVCEAHLCTEKLIEKAYRAGREYQEMQKRHNPNSDYANHDWASDSAVKFLEDHIDYIVWGYNDGA
jgi:hypothetical protein